MLQVAKKIYSYIGDDLSRRIYLNRLNYNISGSAFYLEHILKESVRASSEWKCFCSLMQELRGEAVVLFGNGIWGDTLLREFKGYPWTCIIDNAPNQSDKAGIPIVEASSFMKNYNSEKIVISSFKSRDAMIDQCIMAGVPKENIIDAGKVIYELTEGRIYFDKEIPMILKSGLFIDGGCFDGSDSKRYFEKFHGDSINFEPDILNIKRICETLKGYEKKYRIIPKALWKGEGTISFSSNGSFGSHINKDFSDNMIPTTSIDIETADEEVAMIKMDIEGAELEALHGAENTIKRDHPVLAVSVYHKPEDILDIPEYILSVYGGYRLYLRHYSFSWYDTVLYAIPGVF